MRLNLRCPVRETPLEKAATTRSHKYPSRVPASNRRHRAANDGPDEPWGRRSREGRGHALPDSLCEDLGCRGVHRIDFGETKRGLSGDDASRLVDWLNHDQSEVSQNLGRRVDVAFQRLAAGKAEPVRIDRAEREALCSMLMAKRGEFEQAS
jgi:hypothetical protein